MKRIPPVLLHLRLCLLLFLLIFNQNFNVGHSALVGVDVAASSSKTSSSTSTTTTTTTSVRSDGDPSMMEFFRITLGLTTIKTSIMTTLKSIINQEQHSPSPSEQPIYVISAGLPRTGTASFVIAMKKLGLHSYHMKDGAVETPGHLNLWYNLYRNLEEKEEKNEANKKDNGEDDVRASPTSSSTSSSSSSLLLFNEILDGMSLNGFNVTSDAPACFWYKEQIKRYPNAKVILTVRGDSGGSSDDTITDPGSSSTSPSPSPSTSSLAWTKSFKLAIIDVMVLMKEVPYRWIPMFQKLEYVVQQMLLQLISTLEMDTNSRIIDPNTGYPSVEQLPNIYDTWNKRVKETIPSENLLIFAPQDGWEPLCNFLTSSSSKSTTTTSQEDNDGDDEDDEAPSIPKSSGSSTSSFDSIVKTRCDEIIKSGEPYPYVNDKTKVQSLIWGLYLISMSFKVLCPVAICLIVGLTMRQGLLRMNNQQRQQKMTKHVKSKTN